MKVSSNACQSDSTAIVLRVKQLFSYFNIGKLNALHYEAQPIVELLQYIGFREKHKLLFPQKFDGKFVARVRKRRARGPVQHTAVFFDHIISDLRFFNSG